MTWIQTHDGRCMSACEHARISGCPICARLCLEQGGGMGSLWDSVTGAGQQAAGIDAEQARRQAGPDRAVSQVVYGPSGEAQVVMFNRRTGAPEIEALDRSWLDGWTAPPLPGPDGPSPWLIGAAAALGLYLLSKAL